MVELTVPMIDFATPLAGIGKGLEEAKKRQTLADLGKGLTDGTVGYRQAAGTLASLGDIGSTYKLLELAEAKDKLTRGQAASGQFNSGLGPVFGISPQQSASSPVASGPTVPNDSNAIPGTVGMNLNLADRSQDFIQDNPGTSLSSGVRSTADQARLYADRGNNPNPVAPPGSSNHERGLAVDIGGMTPEQRTMLPQYGLAQPVANDPPHVELARNAQAPQTANDGSEAPANTQPAQGFTPSAANGFQGLNASHIPMLLQARANPNLPAADREFADKLLTRALDDSKPSDKIRTLQALKAQSGYQGSILDLEKELREAGSSKLSVDQRGETEEAKAAGKGAGERRASMFAAASAASKTLMNLSRIEGLLRQVSQGKLEPARMNISAWAKSFGLNDDVAKSLGLDPKGVGSAQALNALTNEMVVGKIGSGGFPANNFSDADREFLLGTVQRLGNDPRANKIITETARRMAQLDIERARGYQQFKANPANKTKGFEDFELQWSDDMSKKDVFGDLRKQAEAIVGVPRTDIGETLNNPAPAPSMSPRSASEQSGGASPARVASPEEARRLPPGTRFVTPDGRELIR